MKETHAEEEEYIEREILQGQKKGNLTFLKKTKHIDSEISNSGVRVI